VVIVACTFRGKRSADRGHRGASAVNRHGNGAALEVRGAPAGHVALHTEAISPCGVEIAGLAARFNVRAGAAAGGRG
jgi:hypothetical protein